MAPRKPPTLSANAHERLEFKRIEERYRTFRTAIRCLLVAVAFYCLYEAVSVLAGRATSVLLKASLDLLADMKFAVTLTLAGAVAIWALVERALRYRKVTTLSKRVAELERGIDPNRSSSALDSRGRTNPNDRRS